MSGLRTFAIEACLGRGGFGEVYRASMTRSGGVPQQVALKVLRPDIDPRGEAVRRLRDEGRLLAQLSHPAILKVHDLVLLEGRISLITELVDGDDLSQCMEDGLPSRAMLEVLAVISSALDVAWSTVPPNGDRPLHMVHRDIKPSNIRISRHGQVKVLDFGIARTDEVDRESRTRTGMMVGSPAYMAPERFLEPGVLLASDVFSMGAMLYESLTGERFYGTIPVPMQVGLAVDEKRYAVHLERALALVGDPGMKELLRRTLAREASERPEPSLLAIEFERMANQMDGASLSMFCRERTWSTQQADDGDLEGRTVEETLLAPPRDGSLSASLLPGTRPPPEPVEPTLEFQPVAVLPPAEEGEDGRIPRRWVFAVVVGFLMVAGIAVLAGAGAAGTMMMWLKPSATVVEQEPSLKSEPTLESEPTLKEPAPVEVNAPATLESGSRLTAPPLEPQPTLATAPRTPPADVTRVAPRPAAPKPEPRSEPVVEIPKGVFVSVQNSPGRMVAVGTSGAVPLPGRLVPGTYVLKASFNGGDLIEAGELSVVEGRARYDVSCSARMRRCGVR